MKRQYSLVLILLMLILAVSMAPQVQAAKLEFKSPLKPGANTYRYQGEVANAYFSSSTDGCIYTETYLFAGETTSKSGSGAPSKDKSATIYINRYDNCNGLWLSSAYGFAPVDGASFQIDQKLNTARLQRTVSMYEWDSGATYDLSVDLIWTGTGDLNRSKSQSQYETNGCKIKNQFSGTWRSAVVTGSISDGATDYAANALFYADLQSVKRGEMNIGCGW